MDDSDRRRQGAERAGVDAWLATRLFALDPCAVGGIVVRAPAGPVRERWLADLRAMLPAAAAWRTAPVHVDDDRLLGGIDLAATLQLGRPVALRGLLGEANGGVLVVPMAERIRRATVAHIAAALDVGALRCARHGMEETVPARFAVVAFDESEGDEASIDPALADRLAFHVDLRDVAWRDLGDRMSAPRSAGASPIAWNLERAAVDDRIVEALCTTASVLGIASIRASLHAIRVAALSASLRGAAEATADDAAVAARLVLAPRATRLPAPLASDSSLQAPTAAPPPTRAGAKDDRDDEIESTAAGASGPPRTPDGDVSTAEGQTDDRDPGPSPRPLEDVVLAAAAAAIPAGLLDRLVTGAAAARAGGAGRSGAWQAHGRRGRPAGVRRGRPGGDARLDVVATMRAAAPWQRLRGRPLPAGATGAPVRIRGEDFHLARFVQRARTTTIFAVDASGSAALHRLAEAKGAVELLLADCYVRRDSVAVIAFRGRTAELLLPPTRSLVRAKRSLAGLAGGGGTPLAAGIDAAAALAAAVRRRGDTPVVVVLSDGRANVGRAGSPGRVDAEADASAAARALRAQGMSVLFVDTSPRPDASARDLAATMGARYVPLPHAEAHALSAAVRAGGVRER